MCFGNQTTLPINRGHSTYKRGVGRQFWKIKKHKRTLKLNHLSNNSHPPSFCFFFFFSQLPQPSSPLTSLELPPISLSTVSLCSPKPPGQDLPSAHKHLLCPSQALTPSPLPPPLPFQHFPQNNLTSWLFTDLTIPPRPNPAALLSIDFHRHPQQHRPYWRSSSLESLIFSLTVDHNRSSLISTDRLPSKPPNHHQFSGAHRSAVVPFPSSDTPLSSVPPPCHRLPRIEEKKMKKNRSAMKQI